MGIDPEKMRDAAPGLVRLYKAAKVSLRKRGLDGQRAAVYLVLDRSLSMNRYYRDGTVQHLAEQVLALAANLDDDGVVPVVFFDSYGHPPVEIGLTDYQGRIDREHTRLGRMGSTNFADAMRLVIDHYRTSGASEPGFVVFQTDGSPDSRKAAEKALCQASTLPIFWQFIGFGRGRFKFLRRLDELPVPHKRAVDNAGFFEAGSDPRSIEDADLYGRLMGEFPDWLAAARAGGILI